MRTSFEDEALGGSAVARIASCSGDNRMDDMGKRSKLKEGEHRTQSASGSPVVRKSQKAKKEKRKNGKMSDMVSNHGR
jgi:hypothetical protein